MQAMPRGIVRRLHAIWLGMVFLMAPFPVNARNEQDTSENYSLGYEYHQHIKDRMRGFGELKYEKPLEGDGVWKRWTEAEATGGVSYDLSERLRLEGGLGLYYNRQEDLPDSEEVRLWQAVTLDWPDSPGVKRRFVFSNRLRLEERYKKTSAWDFSLRLRYQLALSVPVNRYTVEPGAFYVPLKAEFYAPLGDEIPEIRATQSRFTVGVGYVFNKTWIGEIRYARQNSEDSIGANVETTDQTIEFRVKTSVRIRDLLTAR